MDLDTFKPTFLIEIEGQSLSKDITQEIEAFSFTDNEEEMDELELCVSNRNLQFVDDPLFQEGNEIAARFGYVGNLSPRKKAVIKDIDYDFPHRGAPTIRIKAFDKGFKLAGKQNQKVWQKPAPGIAYSDIAGEIASANGLRPVVTPTRDRHLRVAQSNISDAQFLQELAPKARAKDGDGVTGYVFFVQDDELHFHPRNLESAPAITLEYFTDRKGLLRSFNPSTQSQGAKGAGVATKAVGVDPRRKECVEHIADNDTTPERCSLGRRTYLVDGNTGEGQYKEQESGEIVPSFERSEAFDQEPRQEPAQDTAEGKFKEAEMRQVEATAKTIGIPLGQFTGLALFLFACGCQAEPDLAIRARWREKEAERRSAAADAVGPTAAAKNPVQARGFVARVIVRATGVVQRCVPVLAPFIRVSAHVVTANRTHRARRAGVRPIVPAHWRRVRKCRKTKRITVIEIEVIHARARNTVTRLTEAVMFVRSTIPRRCAFPFRLRRQTIAARRRCRT